MEEFQSFNQTMHMLEVSDVTKDGAVFQVSQSGRYIYMNSVLLALCGCNDNGFVIPMIAYHHTVTKFEQNVGGLAWPQYDWRTRKSSVLLILLSGRGRTLGNSWHTCFRHWQYRTDLIWPLKTLCTCSCQQVETRSLGARVQSHHKAIWGHRQVKRATATI